MNYKIKNFNHNKTKFFKPLTLVPEEKGFYNFSTAQASITFWSNVPGLKNWGSKWLSINKYLKLPGNKYIFFVVLPFFQTSRKSITEICFSQIYLNVNKSLIKVNTNNTIHKCISFLDCVYDFTINNGIVQENIFFEKTDGTEDLKNTTDLMKLLKIFGETIISREKYNWKPDVFFLLF
jgi:hypothetical protein